MKIDLTDEQAALFVLFNKHYDSIAVIEACKGFDVRNGEVNLYFRGGKLKSVKRQVIHSVEELPLTHEDVL